MVKINLKKVPRIFTRKSPISERTSRIKKSLTLTNLGKMFHIKKYRV